jgi:hypothetical protein
MESSSGAAPVIQRYQNKMLKRIVNAPWYVGNSDLHRDLGIETVADIIAKFAFIVISESKRLQISSLSSPSLMKRDFKTTSTSKRPDFST